MALSHTDQTASRLGIETANVVVAVVVMLAVLAGCKSKALTSPSPTPTPTPTPVLPGVAVWRPSTIGPAPLIVFSHGFNGCNTQSTFLTSALARAGYLVVAPNHADALCGANASLEEPFRNPQTWSDQTYRARRDDIVQLMATLRADPAGWPIDWSRVGLVGHSLGGYTVLGLGGGWSSWKAAGVSAVVALSPYCEPFVYNGTLGAIGVPVMYQGGTLDITITPAVKASGGCFDKTSSPAVFVEFQGAGHLAWTDLNGQFQDLVIRYTQAFLDTNVKRAPSVDPTARTAGVSDLRVK